jgi:hypothetical protein
VRNGLVELIATVTGQAESINTDHQMFIRH